MAYLRRFILIFLALVLGGEKVFAAGGTKEQRAYAAAVAAFQDEMWSRAATEFAQFVQKYPHSTNAPAATLMQAQAEFKQGYFSNAAALLSEKQSEAGSSADQFIYWLGESEFAISNFLAAADTFASLAQNFPDSPLRLRATVEQSSALAQAGNWPAAVLLLSATNGLFQRAAQLDPNNDLVVRGRLLQAQGFLQQNNFNNAATVLDSINSQILSPELDTGLAQLRFRLALARTDLPAALAAATNLFQAAKLAGKNSLVAESVALRGEVLEKMGRQNDAIAAYSENLKTNFTIPVERRRQAILKIAALGASQNQFAAAETNLENFLQVSNSPAADFALFSLGELELRDYSAGSAQTNLLTEAHAQFDQLISTFTNSPLFGRAFLDRGWCFWLEGDIPGSLPDFQAAARVLPPSEDWLVATFKTGDALFEQKDFADALEKYRAVTAELPDFPEMQARLGSRALCQILSTSLELTNAEEANEAFSQILKEYPGSEFAPAGELLFGETLAQTNHPAAARGQFNKFLKEFPDSPLRPQAAFAVARSYELENDWTNAIAGYEKWLQDFPTNNFRPSVFYALALANFDAGDEARAFAQFTNFIVQFPGNRLAPLAQWWIAGHFFRLGGTNYVDAEKNYEFVYQDFPTNDLAYPARLMAGRAAVARQDYSEAIREYFNPLELDTNCPAPLRVQALFAHGRALMAAPSADTNNLAMNYQAATNVFMQIVLMNPTNDAAMRAENEIANCDLQLGDFLSATNFYAQVFAMNSPADASLRGMAQVGLGIALENEAASATTNQTALLQMALENYLDVFDTVYGKNLRDGETADLFWVKKAGLQALPLIQSLGVAPPDKFIDRMEELLPQLKESLEKMRVSLPPARVNTPFDTAGTPD